MPVVNLFREVYGMQTDPPLADMPKGYMRRILNFIPQPGIAPLRRRAGWDNASAVMGSNSIRAVAYAPFTDAAKFVGIDTGHGIYTFSSLSGGATTLAATGASLIGVPVWHRVPGATKGGYLIIPKGTVGGSTLAPQKFDGSLANLAGSPPEALIAASWGDYLILAQNFDSAAQNNRMWFSAVGNPESWNLTSGYVDLPDKITAVVPRGRAIYVWTPAGTHILRGDTPPPGGNLVLDKFVFSQGCLDQRSVTTYKDYVIWGNANGVFKSDGSQPIDLTKTGGISTYWDRNYNAAAGDQLSLGIYKNFLFCAVIDVSNIPRSTFVYDLDKNSWWEMNNFPVAAFANVAAATGSYDEELLFGDSTRAYVDKISPIFDYTGSPLDDAGSFGPQIITPGYRFGTDAFKRIRRTWLTLQSGTNVAGQIYSSFVGEPTPASTPSDLTNYWSPDVGTQVDKRIRVAGYLNKRFEQVQFQLANTNTDDWAIWSMEAEVDAFEQARGGDIHV